VLVVAIVIGATIIGLGLRETAEPVRMRDSKSDGEPTTTSGGISNPYQADAMSSEVDRETAFAALQRLTINQQRLVDSTEAKLGVLALAVLACFVALVVEPNPELPGKL
jgi:hypothetical protein